ncbi:MAG: signal peptidase II [Acidimicrobiales bacterium]
MRGAEPLTEVEGPEGAREGSRPAPPGAARSRQGPVKEVGRRPWRLRALTAAVAAAAVAADQATKWWAASHLAHHPLHVIGSINFVLAYNSGAAFSLGQGLTTWLEVLGIALVVVLLAVSRRMATRAGAVAIGLVLGGACGNLASRLLWGDGGAVIDWIYTRYWPTFNVADACIVVGAIVLVLGGWRRSR